MFTFVKFYEIVKHVITGISQIDSIIWSNMLKDSSV
jgi:hypothetical protein